MIQQNIAVHTEYTKIKFMSTPSTSSMIARNASTRYDTHIRGLSSSQFAVYRSHTMVFERATSNNSEPRLEESV